VNGPISKKNILGEAFPDVQLVGYADWFRANTNGQQGRFSFVG
jgi:hypothetical protein